MLYAESVLRDDDGRITQKTETFGTDTHVTVYGYDARGRLTDVTTDGTATAHYGYDANDNRTSVTDGAGSASPTYDAQDRLVTYGAASFTFNAAGDLTARTDASGTTTFTYDPLGNLLEVAMPSNTVDYIIDGEQRRVAKELNGAVQIGYLYRDDLHIVAKLGLGPYGYPDATYAIRAHYAYGTKSNVPDVIVGGPYNPGLYRILSDHLGSVRLVVDASSGAIVQRMDYDAFGNVTSDTNPGLTPFGFAGGLYDPDTKLVRFGARDYDPSAGRWTTKDPVRFVGGFNLYAYVSNDPIDLVDPNGEQPEECEVDPRGLCAAEKQGVQGSRKPLRGETGSRLRLRGASPFARLCTRRHSSLRRRVDKDQAGLKVHLCEGRVLAGLHESGPMFTPVPVP